MKQGKWDEDHGVLVWGGKDGDFIQGDQRQGSLQRTFEQS